MNNLFRSCLFGVAIGCTTLASALSIGTEGPWRTYLQGQGRIGDFRQGGQVQLFAPFMQCNDSFVFGQVQGARLKRQWSTQVGLGYRKMEGCNFAWGVNGFFDYTASDRGYNYYQGSFGGEVLYNYWEFRANGYLPSSRRNVLHDGPVDELSLVGTTIGDLQTHQLVKEHAYGGFDGEIGYNLECTRCQRIRLFAGYYHFSAHGSSNMQGPRLRLRYEIDDVFGCMGSRIFAGIDWQHDKLRGGQAAGLLGLRIALGGGCCRSCCCTSTVRRRMNDPVFREPGAVIHCEVHESEPTQLVIGNLYHVSQAGEGDGSIAAPGAFREIFECSEPGDVFVVTGDLETGPLHLKEGQRLIGYGDGEELTVNFGPGRDLLLVNPSEIYRPVLRGAADQTMITLSEGSVVSGLTIEGGLHALAATDMSDFAIADLNVRGTTGDGIVLRGVEGASIAGSTFANIGGSAIHCIDSSDLIFANLTIDGVSTAFQFDQVDGSVTVSECSLGGGIAICGGEGHFTFPQTEIATSGGSLLDIRGTAADIDFTGANLSSTGGGIVVRDMHEGRLNLANCRLDKVSKVGLDIARCTAPITFTGGHISTASGATGLCLDQVENLQISGALTQDRGARALTITGGVGALDLSSLTISSHNLTADSGLSITDRSGDVRFGAVNLSTLNGAGIHARNVTGELQIASGVIATNGGAALNFDGVRSNITLTRLDAREAQYGLRLEDVSGRLDVRGGEIAATQDAAIFIRGGDLNFNSQVGIENTAGHLLRAEGVDRGYIKLSGQRLHDVGARGVSIEECGADFHIANLQIVEAQASAIECIGNTGDITLAKMHIVEPKSDAVVLFDNRGEIFITGGGAIEYVRGNLLSAITAINNHSVEVRGDADNLFRITGASGQAIDVDLADRIVFDHIQIVGGAHQPSTGIRLFDVDRYISVTNSQFIDLEDDGIVIENVNHSGEVMIDIANNKISGMSLSSTALSVNYEGTENSEAHLYIGYNEVAGFDFNGISVRADKAGTVNTLIDANYISDIGFGHGMVVLDVNGPTMNATLRNNLLSATGDEIVVAKAAPSIGNPLRLNLFNNRSPGYQIHSRSSDQQTTAFQLGGTVHDPGTIFSNSSGHVAEEIINNGNRNEKGDLPIKISVSGYHQIIEPQSIPLPKGRF